MVSESALICESAAARFGPKGLGNLAQALAWVALFLRASPVRAPENAGAIHIDRTQIQISPPPLQQLQPGMAGVFHRGRSKVAPYEG